MSLISRLMGRNDPTDLRGPLYEPVRHVMEDVQAYAQSHGGSIQLLGVSDAGEVKIKFKGACVGCPMSALTLKVGIEDRLRQLVPGVSKVVVQ